MVEAANPARRSEGKSRTSRESEYLWINDIVVIIGKIIPVVFTSYFNHQLRHSVFTALCVDQYMRY